MLNLELRPITSYSVRTTDSKDQQGKTKRNQGRALYHISGDDGAYTVERLSYPQSSCNWVHTQYPPSHCPGSVPMSCVHLTSGTSRV